MAFSMFIRNSACSNRIFTQQVMRLATQPLMQRAAAVPLKNLSGNEASTTPILNSVRSFKTTVPRLSEEKAHDHSKLWVIERAVTAAMVPLVPIALMMPNKLCDALLAVLITAHSFWGLEAMKVEYIRVLLFGPFVPKVVMGVVYFITAVMLGGLFYLIFNDIGMARAFWKIWKNMKKPRGFLGLEAIAVDYVRASVVGPILPKVAIALVYLVSIATLGGLFYLISHDVGVAGAVRQLWAVRSQQQA